MFKQMKKSKPEFKSSTFVSKLKISESNGQNNSNYASWILDMKDTISKYGELSKKRFMSRRFSTLSEAKLRSKYLYDIETPVNFETWRAKTIKSDQVKINKIEDQQEKENRGYELYDSWCTSTLKANAIVAANNVVKKSYLERIGSRVQEDKDTNTAIFATVSQYLDQDSRDTIESHIIKDYGKPYQAQNLQFDTDYDNDDYEVTETNDDNNDDIEVDSMESVLSRRSIADTSYTQAEIVGDWVWLLIAAEETHVVRLIGNDQDDQEEVQDREDEKLRKMKYAPGRSLSNYNRLFKIQIDVCLRVDKSYSQSTLMRLYMNSMPEDLFEHEKREYQNPALRANYGNTLLKLQDTMNRKFAKLMDTDFHKYNRYMKQTKEPSFSLKEFKQINNRKQSKTKSTTGPLLCEICGGRYHPTEECNYYKKCHQSLDEAKCHYMKCMRKLEGKSDSDTDSVQSKEEQSKEEEEDVKGSKNTSTIPTTKKQTIARILDDSNSSTFVPTNHAGYIFMQGDTCAAVNMFNERYSAYTKEVNDDKGYLKGVGGGIIESTNSTTNSLGLTRFIKDSNEENTISIPQATNNGKGEWELTINDGDLVLKHKEKIFNDIVFTMKKASTYGDLMPRACMTIAEFQKIFSAPMKTEQSNYMDEFCIDESIDSDIEYSELESMKYFQLTSDEYDKKLTEIKDDVAMRRAKAKKRGKGYIALATKDIKK